MDYLRREQFGLLRRCQIHNSTWHGTHTAGTIGAASNNGDGVAGVNWNSKILPVRALGKCGGFTSDITDGMRWAAGLSVPGAPANDNPARVLNLSLGGAGACETTLEEDDNAGFTSPIPRYNGAGTSWNATGKAAGMYYYRANASNNTGSSRWSNVQPAAVCQNAVLNSGFESGTVNWQQYWAQGWDVIVDITNPDLPPAWSPHGASWAAWEGGGNYDISYVQQTVGG